MVNFPVITGGPTPEAVRWFNDHQGKEVNIKYTGYVGVVHALNESAAGIYNGGRYPIYVKLEAPSQHQGKSMAGKVFEYAIDQLEVLCYST